MPVSTGIFKRPQKKSVLSSQMTKSGAVQQDRKCLPITALLQPNATGKLDPSLPSHTNEYTHQQELSGKPTLDPCQTLQGARTLPPLPYLPTRQKRSSGNQEFYSHLAVKKHLRPLLFSGDHIGAWTSTPTPTSYPCPPQWGDVRGRQIKSLAFTIIQI